MPIRPMLKSDLSKILEIDPIVFPDENPWSLGDMERFFDARYSYVSYDEETNKINGYLFLQKLSKTSFFIGNFGVHPNSQGKGIGQDLMSTGLNKARDEFKSNQNLTVSLQVRKDNPRAKKFYEKNGFSVSGSSTTHEQMHLKTHGLKSENKKTKPFISTPHIDQVSDLTVKNKLNSIVTTLICNIEKKENDRYTSGLNSHKVQEFKKLQQEILNKQDSEIDPQEIIHQIRNLCQIKRNPLHFWSTPHSVKELNQLLLKMDLNIDDPKSENTL
ncbi:TPA: GNAT family N-acetyltransferase [Legionella anisa]|uniref:GNAT family N-acetyltransferase n=1 Tax=Legionella anisa TaxID=28082 RepID=UPI000346B9D5|nr:N-acetyltransferase [Legionella anisa]AWN75372.1 GNAT family N-acetyltransferase [Legionella anisa]MCW8424448.1 GNAT family N-acetyltransferase [Legionella anisa]MCW8446434.1 GNAT family N-acetyltransferase [Legionella anisa]